MDAMLRRALMLGAVLAPLAVASRAHAQEEHADTVETEDPNVAEARELAQTALEKLEAKEYEDALEQAEKAEELYHAPIHLRVMGQALEGLGRRAEAAALYERLVAEPLSPTAHPLFLEAQRIGKERLKHLAARLPSVLIKVQGVKRSVATVTIDDRKIETGPGVAVILDAGKHTVRVEAPDRDTYEKEIELPDRGGVVVLDVPMFAEGEEPPGFRGAKGDEASSGPPIATWALFGAGGALLIAGGVIGTLVLIKANDLEERCPDFQCPPSEESAHEKNVILGWTSTAALAAGGVLVGAGFIVWAVGAGDDDEADTAPAAHLEVGPGSLTLRGRF
jgi:hypothetical protein